jgi:hypothetical protein
MGSSSGSIALLGLCARDRCRTFAWISRESQPHRSSDNRIAGLAPGDGSQTFTPGLRWLKDMRSILTIINLKFDRRTPSSGDGTRQQQKTRASIHRIAVGCGTVGASRLSGVLRLI